MAAPEFTRLDGRFPVARHDHVAVLYRGGPGAFRLSSFLAEGLREKHFCHFLAPGAFHAKMVAALRAELPDLDVHLRSGRLVFHEGLPELTSLGELTQKAFAEAERLRAPALRWLEEGSWPESAGFPMGQYFEFDSILNYQVKHYPSVAVCQYGLDQIQTHHLFSAIAVHRHLLVEDTLVRDNPFYIPAEKFISLTPQERERDLAQVFREVGFDLEKLLAALAGYGRLHSNPPLAEP